MTHPRLNSGIQLSPSRGGGAEISFVGIFQFLKFSYKTILLAGILGFILAITYLSITPKLYEATAQITMAQIGAANYNNNFNPPVVNIEEPTLLIARLSSPTSFTPSVIAACGLESQSNAALVLSKMLKLTIPRGVPNMVELKAFGPSPQIARECAVALFDLIKTTQSLIVAPYIEGVKVKLLDDEERLAKAKDLVVKADKSGSAMDATYLSTRDEIRYLLDEITALKNVVTSNQNRTTRLVTPVYASDVPIAPKKLIILIAGVLGGLFFGLLIVLGLQMVSKLKPEIAGAV